MNGPIEGWAVETRIQGVSELWLVKGYQHPRGHLVAVPYRRGFRRYDPKSFRELSPSWVLSYNPCAGRETPLLDESSVNPIDPKRVLEYREDELPRAARILIENLNPDWSGLTGSWLVFKENRNSDIDIVAFYSNPFEALNAINTIAKSRLVRKCPKPRSAYPISSERILDACIRYKDETIQYTLRILRQLHREECASTLLPMGVYEGAAELDYLGPYDKYLVPAKYRAYLKGLGVNAILETWRTSYQELPRSLYYVRVSMSINTRTGEIIASPDTGGYIRPARV